MSDALSVRISRDDLHSVEVPDGFETDGDFAVELDNRERAVHVHLALDERLSRVASLPEANHFVETESTLRVPVTVEPDADPVTGRLDVVTAYGAESKSVPITVERSRSVRTEPHKSATDARSSGATGPSTRFDLDGSTAVLGLAITAVVVAGAVATAVKSVAVTLGVLVVLLAIAAAFYLVSSGNQKR